MAELSIKNLTNDELQLLEALRTLRGKDYDVRASYIQDLRDHMDNSPETDALIGVLYRYLRASN